MGIKEEIFGKRRTKSTQERRREILEYIWTILIRGRNSHSLIRCELRKQNREINFDEWRRGTPWRSSEVVRCSAWLRWRKLTEVDWVAWDGGGEYAEQDSLGLGERGQQLMINIAYLNIDMVGIMD